MSESTLSLFQKSKQDIITPILPAGQTGPDATPHGPHTGLSLKSHFERAQEGGPSAPAPSAQATNDNTARAELAGSANLVGDSLKEKYEGIKVPTGGGAGYAMASTLNMGRELMGSLFGAPASAEMEEPKIAPQTPRAAMSPAGPMGF